MLCNVLSTAKNPTLTWLSHVGCVVTDGLANDLSLRGLSSGSFYFYSPFQVIRQINCSPIHDGNGTIRGILVDLLVEVV